MNDFSWLDELNVKSEDGAFTTSELSAARCISIETARTRIRKAIIAGLLEPVGNVDRESVLSPGKVVKAPGFKPIKKS